MAYSEPARTAARRTRSTILAALVVVSAVLIGVLIYQSPASSSSSAASPIDTPHRDRHGALGEADGAVPDGVTVVDDEIPAVANLDSDLLGALRRAATDAADDGVEFFVNSGWRSRAYQERLLHEAVSKYGSEKEAARWVATPDTSPHVSGDAAPKPSMTAARPGMPTLRTIQGCSSDQHARHIPVLMRRPPTAHAADEPRTTPAR
jgi:hypothetical protein